MTMIGLLSLVFVLALIGVALFSTGFVLGSRAERREFDRLFHEVEMEHRAELAEMRARLYIPAFHTHPALMRKTA